MRRSCVSAVVLVVLVLVMWPTRVAAQQLEVTLVKLTSPASRGSVVSITIKTAAGAECKGQVRYRTQTQQLASKTSGDDGTATWSWRVGSDARGTYPIDVQCTQGDKKGFLSAQLVVD